MSSSASDATARPRRYAPWRIDCWPVWGLPPNLLAAILLVEVTAVGLLAIVVPQEGLGTVAQWSVAGALAGLGVVHTEAVLRVEQTRRRIGSEHHIDMTSVWFFAGALVLPAVAVAALIVVLQSHLFVRALRPRLPLFKHLFTMTTMVLAALAAHAVVLGAAGPAPIVGALDLTATVVALLVYTVVNGGLVGAVIALNSARLDLATMVGRWDDNLLEIATLCLGAMVAVVLGTNPWLVPLVLPPLLVLHRSVLVRHLQVVADTDGKTGLLNAAAWHTQAEKELRRARKHDVPRGVLVVDLDHFKQVNDRHGHLAGDRVLAAVAGALRAEVRERDLVGRFGGEEFVVLLAGGPTGDGGTAELTAVAERIRLRIAALRVEMPTPDGPLTVAGLSASVGAAFFPDHGTELRELLQVADTALYAAKRAGRNAVRAGVQPVPVDRVDTAETR